MVTSRFRTNRNIKKRILIVKADENQNSLKRKKDKIMIITTTNNVDGAEVSEYISICFGEVIAGVNMFKDMAAGVRNIFGGRTKSYEAELTKAREEALSEMRQRAESLNADAVIGVKMDYEVLGSDNGMLMVTCSGTAVKLK